jgi:hypothetical protein
MKKRKAIRLFSPVFAQFDLYLLLQAHHDQSVELEFAKNVKFTDAFAR